MLIVNYLAQRKLEGQSLLGDSVSRLQPGGDLELEGSGGNDRSLPGSQHVKRSSILGTENSRPFRLKNDH